MARRPPSATVIALLVLSVYQQCVSGAKQAVSDGSCDPVVDMLFVLDNSSNVNSSQLHTQRTFVNDLLKNHQAPKEAVRIGMMICGDASFSSTTFLDKFSPLLETNELPPFKADDVQRRNCLESVNFKFKTESRTGVTRIAVILRSIWNWDELYTLKQSKIARNENTVLVVIAIGVREFESLRSLQALASEDGTFFAVSDYTVLKTLATSLSKDSCKRKHCKHSHISL